MRILFAMSHVTEGALSPVVLVLEDQEVDVLNGDRMTSKLSVFSSETRFCEISPLWQIFKKPFVNCYAFAINGPILENIVAIWSHWSLMRFLCKF